MVLVEASGGLELPLVAALATEELAIVVVNPRQVRDFARATGNLAINGAVAITEILCGRTKPALASVGPRVAPDSNRDRSRTFGYGAA